MKAFKYWGIILMTFGLSACTNDDFRDGIDEGLKTFTSFTATIGEPANTRLSMGDVQDGKRSVWWDGKDEIVVFSDVDPELKIFWAIDVDGNKATFGGNDKVSGTEFYAYFPAFPTYSSQTVIEKDADNPNIIHVNLSSHGFSEGSLINIPMLAVSQSNNLVFKQLGGMIHFSITGVTWIDEIYFRGNNGEKLYGPGTIDLSAEEPVIELEYSQAVTAASPTTLGGEFRSGYNHSLEKDEVVDIYFPLPPMVFEKGFGLEVKSRDATGAPVSIVKKTTASVEIKRGEINHYPTVNIEEELRANDPIIFADNNVKALCVENWDTNGDGELSYAEAAAVTDIGQVFKANEDIVSFNEFQYFTGVTSTYSAFDRCVNLTSIKLPNSLVEIGSSTFYTCSSLLELEIPESVISLGVLPFTACRSLTSINIPSGVTSIPASAFADCSSLTSVNLPSGVTDMGMSVFERCTSLSSIVLPEGLTYIPLRAFYGCENLSNVKFPETLEIIISNAFYGCVSLTRIEIPAAVEQIESYAFYGCENLSNVKLHEGLIGISHDAFRNCVNLNGIELPQSLKSIGGAVFSESGLFSVVIPGGVIAVGERAFKDCDELTSVTSLPLNPPQLSSNAFDGSDCPIYVPSASLEDYRNAAGWIDYADRIKAILSSDNIRFADTCVKTLCVENWDTNGDGELSYAEAAAVTDIGQIFRGQEDIISFNEFQYFTGVTSTVDSAFDHCINLTSIKLPNSLVEIGNAIFYGCSNLIKLEIPESVTSIGVFPFYGCRSLTSVNIPSGVTRIPIYAFADCRSLENLKIPSGVTDIGIFAFYDCTSLAYIMCTPVNPPVLSFNALYGTEANIFVPAGSEDSYKNDQYWSPYADRIKTIPE